MSGRSICVVGSINTDTTYTVRQLPGPGETILADTSQVSHGGKGANQAAAAAASGGSVAMVASVGDDDENGTAAVHDLEVRGIDVEGIAHALGAPTGSAVIVVSDDGENTIVVDPGANHALETAWVEQHVGRLAPGVILAQLEIPTTALVAAASAAPSATFVLNPAPMPADTSVLEDLLDTVDVLVPNRTELAQLVDLPEPWSPDEIDHCASVLGFDGTLVVTLGSDGAVIYAGSSRIVAVPAMDVDAIDTSGAGDAFCGGLAHHLALGEPMEDAVRRATELAGASTTHRGARLPLG
jgi:ribokinase